MATVSFAKEDDLIELRGDFGERSERLDVTHETVLRGDTRGVSTSEKFWDCWYWFWRSLTRLRCSCRKGWKQTCFRERYALAWSIVVVDLISIILYAAAAGTIEWSVVVAQPDRSEYEQTRITLGLFSASNYSDAGLSDIRRYEVYPIGTSVCRFICTLFQYSLFWIGIVRNYIIVACSSIIFFHNSSGYIVPDSVSNFHTRRHRALAPRII